MRLAKAYKSSMEFLYHRKNGKKILQRKRERKKEKLNSEN